MKILACSDSFKGSLSSLGVNRAIANALQSKEHQVECVSMSDGGEGFLDLWSGVFPQMELRAESVQDPLGRSVQAKYGWDSQSQTLVLEMAQASGLPLLNEDERNPLNTSSFGTGQLLALANRLEAQEVILGVGGSATNEGGLGALQALGTVFKDASGTILEAIRGKDLLKINSADFSKLFETPLPKMRIVCDVQNPLLGAEGATYTFGAQKGASVNDQAVLEKGMRHALGIVSKELQAEFESFATIPGGGAAGGIAGFFHMVLGAELLPGIQLVMEKLNLGEKIRESDIVITGEGKLDYTSLQGKVVSGVLENARAFQKSVWVLCGQCDLTESEWKQAGVEKVLCLTSHAGLDECMNNTEHVITSVVRTTVHF